MEIKGKNAEWYEVRGPTPRIVEYLRRGVPQTYRYYSANDGCWTVHAKYAQAVAKLGGCTITAPTNTDPYAVLHLLPTAPESIIKAVWRELARSLHPDHGGDPVQFQQAKEAYDSIISKKV